MSTTQAALLDALTECQQFLEDMHAIPPEWAIKGSQLLHAKLTAILAAANAAPTEQARIAQAEQRMLDILVHGMSITRMDPTSIRADQAPQAAPALDETGEHDHNQHNKLTLAVMRVFQAGDGMATPVVAGKCVDAVLAALSQAIAEDAPVAWLYRCKKPGEFTTYASVDENDTNHWPIDQWASIEKLPLYTRQQPQECGTGAMCCYAAAMRDHEEEKPQELPVMSDEEQWQLLDGLREAVSDFRKATYEFALRGGQDNHKLMIEAQKRIFDEVRALLSRKPSADKEASK